MINRTIGSRHCGPGPCTLIPRPSQAVSIRITHLLLAASLLAGSLHAQVPAELRTNPTLLRLEPGERRRLLPAVFDENGRLMSGVAFTYASLDTLVARADEEGGVTAVGRGTTTVMVRGGGILGEIRVLVGVPERAARMDPATAGSGTRPVSISAGRDTLILAQGALDTLVPQGARPGVTWRSGDPAVLEAGPTGIVQATGPGRTVLFAVLDRDTVALPVIVHAPVQGIVATPSSGLEPVVLPLEGHAPFSAVALDARGNPIPDARVNWTVGDSSVIEFDQALGEARARAPGITTLIARSGPVAMTWIVRVAEERLAFGESTVALLPGASVRLSPRFGATSGRENDIAAWRTSNAAVAVPDSTGQIRVEGLGRATLTARSRSGAEAAIIVHGVGDLLATTRLQGAWRTVELLSTRPDIRARVVGDLPPVIEAVPSPGRTRLLVRSPVDGGTVLLADAHGGDPATVLARAGTGRGMAWMPSGERAIVTVGDSLTQLWSVDLATGRSMRLTGGGSNDAPAVHPAGDLIAFVSSRDGEDHVYAMKPDGSDQVRLTRGEGPESGPAFLPDGGLVYARDPAGGPWEVVRVPPEGGVPVVLFRSTVPIVSVVVSRDGEMVAWLTDEGRFHLMDFASRHEVLPLGPAAVVGRVAF